MGSIHLRDRSIPHRVFNYLKANRCCVISDLKEYGSKKSIATALLRLYKRGFTDRTRFQTQLGHIYYMDDSKSAIRYGVARGIVPPQIPFIIELIEERGYVTNLELIYQYNIQSDIIRFFYYKIIKHQRLFKQTKTNKINVYHRHNFDIKEAELDRSKEIQKELGAFRQSIGKYLEDVLEQVFIKAGFLVRRGVFSIDPVTRQKVFFDFILSKQLDEDNLLPPLKVVVEVKNRKFPITSNDLFKIVTRCKNIFGWGVPIWIFSVGGISYYLFNPREHEYPYLRSYPFIKVFGLSHIRKLCKKYEVELDLQINKSVYTINK